MVKALQTAAVITVFHESNPLLLVDNNNLTSPSTALDSFQRITFIFITYSSPHNKPGKIYFPSFVDRDTEAQRGEAAYLKSHSW